MSEQRITADAPGTSTLTREQQAVWLEKRGQHYVAVAEQPLRPSRRVRRARKGKSVARNLTQADVDLAATQHNIRQAIAQANIRPVL